MLLLDLFFGFFRFLLYASFSTVLKQHGVWKSFPLSKSWQWKNNCATGKRKSFKYKQMYSYERKRTKIQLHVLECKQYNTMEQNNCNENNCNVLGNLSSSFLVLKMVTHVYSAVSFCQDNTGSNQHAFLFNVNKLKTSLNNSELRPSRPAAFWAIELRVWPYYDETRRHCWFWYFDLVLFN